jgi:NDP-sugar pyrophosphorylase family protein
MFPLNTIMEKSLLPINGKPVIRHIVENLTVPEVARHLRKITICCLDKFKKQFEHEFRDMPSIEIMGFLEPIGTATTFLAAIEKENNIDDFSMIHYADCLTEIDYSQFIEYTYSCKKHYGYNPDGVIAVTNKVKHDYSEVIIDNEFAPNVIEFKEKPLIPTYTWSGIGLFNPQVFRTYTPSTERLFDNIDIATHILPRMVETNRLRAYPYNGYWYDMGNLNSYRKVCDMFNHI